VRGRERESVLRRRLRARFEPRREAFQIRLGAFFLWLKRKIGLPAAVIVDAEDHLVMFVHEVVAADSMDEVDDGLPLHFRDIDVDLRPRGFLGLVIGHIDLDAHFFKRPDDVLKDGMQRFLFRHDLLLLE
jgi:hypothetical protein